MNFFWLFYLFLVLWVKIIFFCVVDEEVRKYLGYCRVKIRFRVYFFVFDVVCRVFYVVYIFYIYL